jgi:hypothetical protein
MISEPISLQNGTWAVQTRHGTKIFSDGETAEDFYLINKHRESQQNGNPSNPRQQ